MEYDHLCTNEECKHEWSDSYSIKADPPKFCPKCNQETAKRLISGTGYGRMNLSDDEFKASLPEEVRKMKQRASKEENYMANLIGEERSHKKLLGKF